MKDVEYTSDGAEARLKGPIPTFGFWKGAHRTSHLDRVLQKLRFALILKALKYVGNKSIPGGDEAQKHSPAGLRDAKALAFISDHLGHIQSAQISC